MLYSGYCTVKCLTTQDAMKPAPPVIRMFLVSDRTCFGQLMEQAVAYGKLG